MPAGSVRLTSPDCAVVDQLCTTTGTRTVSPTAIDWIAAERLSRRAAEPSSSSHSSYSAHLPKRWKRPSAGDTTRTTSSV